MTDPLPHDPSRAASAWRAAGATHRGRVRDHNEDRYYCDATEGLFVVIDGVGGHRAGEVAAGIALDVVVGRLRRRTGRVEERLREAVALANNEIYRQARTDPEREGMACVLTAAVLEGDALTIGHVGDTRLYRARGGRIEKLTRDHSPVGVQEDAGALSEHEAMRHPRRNEIYRDVGSAPRDPDDDAFVDVLTVAAPSDAAFLLCSDGLTDLVSSDELLGLLEDAPASPERVAAALIDRANDAGGKDNVTAVVLAGADFGRVAGDGKAPQSDGTTAPTDDAPRSAVRRRRERLALAFGAGVVAGVLLLTFLQAMLLGDEATGAVGRTFEVAADSSAPYVSVAAALGAARDGDRVRVAAGTYPERVSVPDGVSLIGGEGVVLRPPPDSAAAVVLGARSRLEGVSLEGGEGAPGVVVVGAAAGVDGVAVRGFGTAVRVDSAASVTIRASRLSGNRRGVVVAPGGAARVLHAILTDTGTAADTAGTAVVAPAGADVVLDGVVFGRNGGGAFDVTPSSRTTAWRDRNVFIDPL